MITVLSNKLDSLASNEPAGLKRKIMTEADIPDFNNGTLNQYSGFISNDFPGRPADNHDHRTDRGRVHPGRDLAGSEQPTKQKEDTGSEGSFYDSVSFGRYYSRFRNISLNV